MNKIVYSQLAAATINGTANRRVTKNSDTKDGHAAWNSLVDWFDEQKQLKNYDQS